jgi:hypothetical protein
VLRAEPNLLRQRASPAPPFQPSLGVAIGIDAGRSVDVPSFKSRSGRLRFDADSDTDTDPEKGRLFRLAG